MSDERTGTEADQSVSCAARGLSPGIGADDREKSEGKDHLFVYIAERDIAVSGINIIIVNSNIRQG